MFESETADEEARARSSNKQPVKLIIDTDMSSDVDDVAAVCIAHALADAGEAKLAAVVHNTGLTEGAGAISVINHYYGRDDVPIGRLQGPIKTVRTRLTRRDSNPRPLSLRHFACLSA